MKLIDGDTTSFIKGNFIVLTFILNICGNTRIAVVPSFVGLRKFSQGRNFKQWTGNDTKALMKVNLFLNLITINIL
jgi:hypothetical protein